MSCLQAHSGNPETGIMPDITAQAAIPSGDHSSLIQDAIDYAACMGMTSIVLPDTGIVWNAAALNFDGVSLVNRTTLRWVSGATVADGLATFTNGASIYGGRLEGNAANNADSDQTHGLIYVVENPKMEIIDVAFFDAPATAVYVDLESPGGSIRGGSLISVGKYGIIVRSSGWSIDGVQFEGVGYNDGHMIRFGHWSTDRTAIGGEPPYPPIIDNRVTNCTFRYSQGVGVLCELDAHGTIVMGCIADSIANLCKTEDPLADDVRDTIVLGNQIRDLNLTGTWDTETLTWTRDDTSPPGDADLGCRGMLFANNILNNTKNRLVFASKGACLGNQFFGAGNGTGTVTFNWFEEDPMGGPDVPTEAKAGGEASHNLFVDCRGGVYVSNSKDVDVFNNRIFLTSTSADRGVVVGGDSHRARDNQVSGGQRGLWVLSNATNVELDNNDVADNASPLVYSVTSTTAAFNVVRDNKGASDAIPDYVIASDAITVGRAPNARVDTQGAAATDDLATINGGYAGQLLTLRTASSSRDVTVKDNVGNIQLAGGDFVLDNVSDSLTLLCTSTSTWVEIARANNA